MAPDDDTDTDDRKVKEMLTAETQADLERWFGLPSFQELEDKGIEVDDPDANAAREQREKAMAAVDPALLAAIETRTYPAEKLLQFIPNLEVHATDRVLTMDETMAERAHLIAEPREVEIPDELRFDLESCTPQALLRDLHRAELHFEKIFEILELPEHVAPIDASKLVGELMRMRWSPSVSRPFLDARADILAVKAERRQSWSAWCAASPLPYRKWEQDQ
ncbi:MAG: hypothetical protein ABI867_13715 [Kofleriaceae bacterium]